MNRPANLREVMPVTTGWIDDLRAVFGAEGINAAIRGGMSGVPTFHACENGIEVGTKWEPRGRWIGLAEMVIETDERKKTK